MSSISSHSRDDAVGSRGPSCAAESVSADQLRTELIGALGSTIPRSVLPQTRVMVSDEQWVAALIPFCTGARRLRLPIELVIVTCKEAWRSLPAARQIPDEEHEVLMSRLVTLCIETYFAFPSTEA